jgi:hypothetical protein
MVSIPVRPLPGSDDQMPLCNCVDHISSADNAHQFSLMQDWNALDFLFGEEHRNLTRRSLFTYGDDFVAHNIGLCDNSDDLAMRIDDGRTAHMFLRKKTGSFLRTGAWMDSMDMACHDMSRAIIWHTPCNMLISVYVTKKTTCMCETLVQTFFGSSKLTGYLWYTFEMYWNVLGWLCVHSADAHLR